MYVTKGLLFFWLVLGWTGIHRFIMGRYITGMIYVSMLIFGVVLYIAEKGESISDFFIQAFTNLYFSAPALISETYNSDAGLTFHGLKSKFEAMVNEKDDYEVIYSIVGFMWYLDFIVLNIVLFMMVKAVIVDERLVD